MNATPHHFASLDTHIDPSCSRNLTTETAGTRVRVRSCQLPVTGAARCRAHSRCAGLASCLAAAQAVEDKCPARHVTPPTCLDADVLGAFRAGAVGWEMRVNAALREWLASLHPSRWRKQRRWRLTKVLAKRQSEPVG